MVVIQDEPIMIDDLISAVSSREAGALVLFLGTVRDRNEGRRVVNLDYHAYGPMAESEMKALRKKALGKYEISDLGIVHRTGRHEIGDIAVAIAVAAVHREPSFDACRFMIDSLKKKVPIWKKERFAGGEVWIEGGETIPSS